MEKKMRGKRAGIFVLVVCMFVCLHAQEPGTLKWEYEIDGWIDYSPGIGPDGTVYIGSGGSNLCAINPDGTEKWTFEIGDWVTSAPTIGSDGTIYFGSEDEKLYSISPEGSLNWTFEVGKWTFSSPAIGLDGTIYVGSDDDNLYAVHPDGTRKWVFETDDFINSSPAIGSDGTIYFGSADCKLYAVHPDGTLKWAYETGETILSSPAIGSDGTIYIGSDDMYLYAINTDGSLKWMFETGGLVSSSPAIGSDGTIYVGSYDGCLYAVNPDGTLKWTFETEDIINSSPAIGSDGTIYIGSFDNRLYAINPDGTQNWLFDTLGWVLASPAIGPDGTVYIAQVDNKLCAVRSGSAGLAAGPWPCFQQNSANTGLNQGFSIQNDKSFHFVNPGQSVQKQIVISNPTDHDVTVGGCSFSNDSYSLVTTLPLTVTSGSAGLLTYTVSPDKTALYQSDCRVTYENNGTRGILSANFQTAIFLKDESEQALVAGAVYHFYQVCTQEKSQIAALNNLGLVYRFLGSPEMADQNLESALVLAQESNYGYAGIKMNCGVVRSDQDADDEAVTYYAAAWQDVCLADSSTSALAPQILYNQAWEYYQSVDYVDALTALNNVINHGESTDWLMAKACVLRGAVYHQQGDAATGDADFNQAILYDPEGPIGNIARENLGLPPVAGVEDGEGQIPGQFTLLPNYPNPFNPETVIEFSLPEAGVVEAAVYNVLGEKVRTIVSAHYGAGWHRLTWRGIDDAGVRVGSGIYLLKIRTGDKVLTGKMSLLR